jgi:hypothetical protein
VADEGQIDPLAQHEAVADDLDVPIPALLDDALAARLAGRLELSVEPDIVAVDMGRPDPLGPELLSEPNALPHSSSKQQRRVLLGVQPLPMIQDAAEDAGSHDRLDRRGLADLLGRG